MEPRRTGTVGHEANACIPWPSKAFAKHGWGVDTISEAKFR